VRVAVRGASNRSLDVSLRAGASVAEHVTQRITSTDTAITLSLSFIPTAVGATSLQISATLNGFEHPAVADAVVDARERRWPVLFFDARPSWTSTFVRRALERDQRFVVTSRIVTSRGVGSSAGRPPVSLADAAILSTFDAIVVGAPDGLSASDVAGLDAFMRRRGGSVVLLLEGRTAGPYDRLTGVTTWSSRTAAATLTLSRTDSATLRVTEIVSPGALPPGAAVVARGSPSAVWESAVGAGRLIVSGAVDAWRFRDPAVSGFDRFWQSIIADAATSAPPPVSVNVTPKNSSFDPPRMTSGAVATSGERLAVNAVVRDVALQPAVRVVGNSPTVRASMAAVIEPGTTPVRLWPNAEAGQFTGVIRAPRAPGVYRLVVAGDDGTPTAPIVVATDVHRVSGTSRRLLDAWAKSRGGRLFHASEMGALSAALQTDVRPPSRSVTWHPFRSPWWIVPFALALSGEWWLRRRRGLR
jgi:hypothetical protein